MANGKEISTLVRLEGGIADTGVLDIHEAATTIYGLARSFNMVVHALANDEAIRQRAKNAHGGQVVINPAKKGCFEEQIDVRLDYKTVMKIGPSVIANVFWDYLAWCWSSAVGKDYDPTTRHVQKLKEKTEKDPDFVFIYEIADALERPMAHIHQAIYGNEEIKIILARPRVGDVLTLDRQTLQYVTIREEEEAEVEITGNVTKFNVLTDFGRLYSDNEGKVISFVLEHSTPAMRSLVVQSMKRRVDGEEGKLKLRVKRTVSGHGFVKRYSVLSIEDMQEDEWLN